MNPLYGYLATENDLQNEGFWIGNKLHPDLVLQLKTNPLPSVLYTTHLPIQPYSPDSLQGISTTVVEHFDSHQYLKINNVEYSLYKSSDCQDFLNKSLSGKNKFQNAKAWVPNNKISNVPNNKISKPKSESAQPAQTVSLGLLMLDGQTGALHLLENNELKCGKTITQKMYRLNEADSAFAKQNCKADFCSKCAA